MYLVILRSQNANHVIFASSGKNRTLLQRDIAKASFVNDGFVNNNPEMSHTMFKQLKNIEPYIFGNLLFNVIEIDDSDLDLPNESSNLTGTVLDAIPASSLLRHKLIEQVKGLPQSDIQYAEFENHITA